MLDIDPAGQSFSKNGNMVNSGNETENVSTQPGILSMKPREAARNIFLENETKNSQLVGIFTLTALAIVLIVAGFLFYLKSNKQSQLDTKERIRVQYQKELASPELKQVDTIATRYNLGLKELAKLITGSFKYTKLFTRLEEVTPNEVIIKSFSVDVKNSVKIDAQANSVESLATFARALENTSEFTNIVVSGKTSTVSTTDSAETYGFTITCNLNLDQNIDSSVGGANAI